jgi:predicted HicB family RNase H-like nuclease
MSPVDKYSYRITWSEEDGEFVGLCAELPSLSWLAESQELALKGIKKVVRDAVADMKANGEPVPEPLSAKRYSGELRVRLPPTLHRRLAIQAAEEKRSLNRLIVTKLVQNG